MVSLQTMCRPVAKALLVPTARHLPEAAFHKTLEESEL